MSRRTPWVAAIAILLAFPAMAHSAAAPAVTDRDPTGATQELVEAYMRWPTNVQPLNAAAEQLLLAAGHPSLGPPLTVERFTW